jgi:hypothetical protein
VLKGFNIDQPTGRRLRGTLVVAAENTAFVVFVVELAAFHGVPTPQAMKDLGGQ